MPSATGCIQGPEISIEGRSGGAVQHALSRSIWPMDAPSPEAVRAALAHFDVRRQKVVAGLFGVMIQNPIRVRDREWICQQLTEMATLAGDFEAESAPAAIAAVEEFLQENSAELLSAAYLLFQRVGLDLSERVEEGFSFEDAMRAGLEYLRP